MNSELNAMRIRMYTKKREQQEQEFNALKTKMELETQQKLKFLQNQFEKTDEGAKDEDLNENKNVKIQSTESEDIGVGLVTLQEIAERRKQKQEEEKAKKKEELEKKKLKKKQEMTKMKRLLSISEEEETESPLAKRRKTENEEKPQSSENPEKNESNPQQKENSTEKTEKPENKANSEEKTEKTEEKDNISEVIVPEIPILRAGFGKNDSVETSFLPDRKKELEKKQKVKELAKTFEEQQEQVKKEKIMITYSIFDAKIGMGHRCSITCEKGTSVEQFLASVLNDWANNPELAKKSKQLAFTAKKIEASDLIWVKEDCIIPHHYTFYDLIVTKARGKSGPLWKFDVADDIRLMNDTSKETESTHASKIMEKAWYEKNKHLFPFNRFEYYDPSKDYGKYSIK